MNWINFVKEHPGSLHFQRIGKGHVTSSQNLRSNILSAWVRETNKSITLSN